MPRISVLIPTHDHGPLLRCAYQSLVQQTEQDFELFIICDGATAETTNTAEDIAASDTRVYVHHYPKSPRTGEAYRHEVITKHARGDFIFYLSDDDLWMPDHLQKLCQSLNETDFVSSQYACIYVTPDNHIESPAVDLGLTYYKKLLQGTVNRISLSAVAHRRTAYLTLPHGWRTTPAGIYTDHYMWQQWLSQKGLRFGSLLVPTVINFPSPLRKEMTLTMREQELSLWLEQMRSDEELAKLSDFLNEGVVRSLTAQAAHLEENVTSYQSQISKLVKERKRLMVRIANRLHRSLFGDS